MIDTRRVDTSGRIFATAGVWSHAGLVIARYGLVAIRRFFPLAEPAFPALSATGGFLIKDLVLLGASAFTAGEALAAARAAGAAA
jgi:hypothetical protein